MLIVISVLSLYKVWPISLFLFKKCMQQNFRKTISEENAAGSLYWPAVNLLVKFDNDH